ncbi:putative papain-like cysteine peptidase superfamily [Helianthus annuus]|nr:putative papain-like cysteine peptidase superfamily [Helianthus annuus]
MYGVSFGQLCWRSVGKMDKGSASDIILIFYEGMVVYASRSGANIRVKLIWNNARCPCQPEGIECGYYVMKFMKEIAYEGVEILYNDNVGKRVEEYLAADMDGIRED